MFTDLYKNEDKVKLTELKEVGMTNNALYTK